MKHIQIVAEEKESSATEEKTTESKEEDRIPIKENRNLNYTAVTFETPKSVKATIEINKVEIVSIIDTWAINSICSVETEKQFHIKEANQIKTKAFIGLGNATGKAVNLCVLQIGSKTVNI